MWSSPSRNIILAAAVLSAGARLEVRQAPSVATCTYAQWASNSNGETPCQLYTKLVNACDATAVIAPITNVTSPYPAPTGTSVNDCVCNVVAYNLMAACTWCQPALFSADWLTEKAWSANCPNYNAAALPATVQGFTSPLPGWATAPANAGQWQSYDANILANQAAGIKPEDKPSSSNTGSGSSSGGSSGKPSGSVPAFQNPFEAASVLAAQVFRWGWSGSVW